MQPVVMNVTYSVSLPRSDMCVCVCVCVAVCVCVCVAMNVTLTVSLPRSAALVVGSNMIGWL